MQIITEILTKVIKNAKQNGLSCDLINITIKQVEHFKWGFEVIEWVNVGIYIHVLYNLKMGVDKNM
jgi:hypothetical protein